jgi:hypothetical protein
MNDVIVGHGISLLRWRSGGVKHPHDMPPFRFPPSPTLGDSSKLTPEGEVIAAYGAAMVAAFQVLINCLEENDAVLPGQFPDALGVYMEIVKSKKGDVSDMTLAVLHDIRTATQD